MKIFVYNYREFDEAEYFEKFSKEYHVELGICKEAPSLENAYLVKGYEYVSIITTKIDRPLLEKFREFGVKMISTRTVGYDHIDLEAARQLQGVRGRHEVGDAPLAGLRIHAHHGLVGAAHVVRVDRQVGQLPHDSVLVATGRIHLRLAGRETLLDRVLVRAGETRVDEVADVGSARRGDRKSVV